MKIDNFLNVANAYAQNTQSDAMIVKNGGMPPFTSEIKAVQE